MIEQSGAANRPYARFAKQILAGILTVGTVGAAAKIVIARPSDSDYLVTEQASILKSLAMLQALPPKAIPEDRLARTFGKFCTAAVVPEGTDPSLARTESEICVGAAHNGPTVGPDLVMRASLAVSTATRAALAKPTSESLGKAIDRNEEAVRGLCVDLLSLRKSAIGPAPGTSPR